MPELPIFADAPGNAPHVVAFVDRARAACDPESLTVGQRVLLEGAWRHSSEPLADRVLEATRIVKLP